MYLNKFRLFQRCLTHKSFFINISANRCQFSSNIATHRNYGEESDDDLLDMKAKSKPLSKYTKEDIDRIIAEAKGENVPSKIVKKRSIPPEPLQGNDKVFYDKKEDPIYGKRVAEFDFFPNTFTKGYQAPNWIEMYSAAKFWAFGQHAEEIYKYEKNHLYFDFETARRVKKPLLYELTDEDRRNLKDGDLHGLSLMLHTINRNPHYTKLQREYIVETMRNLLYRDKERIRANLEKFNMLMSEPQQKQKVQAKGKKKTAKVYKGEDADSIITEEETKQTVEKVSTGRRRMKRKTKKE